MSAMDLAETLEFEVTEDAYTAPLGLLLGADSLTKRRSGIGRVTLEIAQRLHNRPEVAGHRFLVGEEIYAPAVLWDLFRDDDVEQSFGHPTAPSLLRRAVREHIGHIGIIRKINENRRRLVIRSAVQDFRTEMQGRLVYYEPNFIAAPFEGTTVVEVNDLSWMHHPECHPAERLTWVDRNLPRTLKQAQRFVSISNFTADAMVTELGVDRNRIDVVPLAPSAIFRPVALPEAAPILARYGLEDGAYILSVSTLEPRKNFDRLLAAHSALPESVRLRFPLVIAGGIGWGDVLISRAAEKAMRDGSMKLLGHVTDQDLVALMARCTAFAYLSLYEGFGLPIVEAMACGAPVIASQTTAAGETAGNATILANPLDDHEIGQAMRRLIDDQVARRKFSSAGLMHAGNFTWDHTMTGLIASWRRALSETR